jgi:hypothetical protein
VGTAPQEIVYFHQAIRSALASFAEETRALRDVQVRLIMTLHTGLHSCVHPIGYIFMHLLGPSVGWLSGGAKCLPTA